MKYRIAFVALVVMIVLAIFRDRSLRKREAEDYLFKDQRDFPLVCQSAGLDVGQLRTKLARLKPTYEADPLKLRRIWGTMLAQQ